MFKATRRFASKLLTNTSGNATMMVAIGIPALIGASGLAVDFSQWYMWKRELQYAVDQAAVAGAFARSGTDTQNIYSARALQEYNANLSVIDSIASTPTITLSDYDGGTDNLVTVVAEATDRLPFSSFLTGRSTTVKTSAKATFVSEGTWTSCLIALDASASKAVWFNGGPDVNAGCGVAAISNASNAVEVSGGSGSLSLGWVIAAGGVDNYFDNISGTIVVENATNLYDPFAGLTPPTNSTPRTVDCSSSPSSYTTVSNVTVTITEYYYEGPKKNNMSLVGSSQISSNTTSQTGSGNSSTQVGDTTTTTSTNEGRASKSGGTWYRTDTVTETTETVTAVSQSGGGSAQLQPGTYSDFDVSGLTCDMAPGIYVIDGGTLNTQGGSLTGNGVMFVLKNGAGIKINGGGNINISAMSMNELISEGISSANAEKLEGMLIFEDPNSSGNSKNKINGNASTFLNGTIYLPNSPIVVLGTAGVTSRCLMIAANTIKIGGTADLSTFCPPGLTHETEVATGSDSVRLVA